MKKNKLWKTCTNILVVLVLVIKFVACEGDTFNTSNDIDGFKSIKNICVDQHMNIVHSDNIESFSKGKLVACASYYESEGWHIFNVENTQDNSVSNKLLAFSAGILEGYVYHQMIDYHYTNIFSTIMNKDNFSNKTLEYVYNQYKYIEDRVDYNESQEDRIYSADKSQFLSQSQIEYQETLTLIVNQHKGMYHGYQLASSGKEKILSKNEFYLLTMQGDLEDILIAFDSDRFDGKTWKKDKDCSGFVKYVKDTKNLIVGHNTHNHYSLMNRIYKNYKLNFVMSNGKSLNNMKFSSRPGDLNSKDDYYILSNNMVVIETSLEVVDLSIYKNLRYDTLPKWIRVNIANRLAQNNLEWINLFFEQNSGTHNNQWLIVDYNKFNEYTSHINKKKSSMLKFLYDFNSLFSEFDYDLLQASKGNHGSDFEGGFHPKDIVHIVEQTPNLDKKYYKDMSDVLMDQSYVASYNSPFFEDVIKDMGYSEPPYNNHDYFHARRFFLFNQLQANVTDINSAKEVMRFHSKEDICDTIGARCDMIKKIPFGAVDVKITDSQLMKHGQTSEIIFGPPFLPGVSLPFDFRDFPNVSHEGIPDRIEFKWIYA